MDEAERRYLAEIAEDCHGLLGSGSTVLKIERQDIRDGVKLVVRFEFRDDIWEGIAVGETVVEAHARLRDLLLTHSPDTALDRTWTAFRSVITSRTDPAPPRP